MKNSFKILLFCFTSFMFIGCDRITKDLAKEHLKNEAPKSYFHDTFRLEYAENTGAAMSFGADLPQPYNFLVFSLLPLLFLGTLFSYAIRQSRQMSLAKMLSLSMVVSGGIGNIIDRIFFDRHVPDFLNLGFQSIRTGIFNVADIYVSMGAIGLLLFFKDE